VASTAVNGSMIVYSCMAPAGTNYASPAFKLTFAPPDRAWRDPKSHNPLSRIPCLRPPQLAAGIKSPKAHRDTLACNEIFLAHLASGG